MNGTVYQNLQDNKYHSKYIVMHRKNAIIEIIRNERGEKRIKRIEYHTVIVCFNGIEREEIQREKETKKKKKDI